MRSYLYAWTCFSGYNVVYFINVSLHPWGSRRTQADLRWLRNKLQYFSMIAPVHPCGIPNLSSANNFYLARLFILAPPLRRQRSDDTVAMNPYRDRGRNKLDQKHPGIRSDPSMGKQHTRQEVYTSKYVRATKVSGVLDTLREGVIEFSLRILRFKDLSLRSAPRESKLLSFLPTFERSSRNQKEERLWYQKGNWRADYRISSKSQIGLHKVGIKRKSRYIKKRDSRARL